MQPNRKCFLGLLSAVALAAALSLAGARPAASQLAPLDLHPDEATQSVAQDINNAGQVVGAYVIETSSTAVIWDSAGEMTELVYESWPYGNTFARGINDSGQVYGSISLPWGMSTGAFLWDSIRGIRYVPKLVHDGTTDWEFTPTAMNDNGWLIGGSYSTSGGRGWIYRDGVDGVPEEITDPRVPGSRITARAINNAGQVVGQGNYEPYSAIIWEKDADGNVTVTDLFASSEAIAINDAGQVAVKTQGGEVYRWSGGILQPVVLPTEYVKWWTRVVAIDKSGRIFGTGVSGGSPLLWMWQDGVMSECPVSGVQLADYDTFRINNAGQMTGTVYGGGNVPHGFLWNAIDGDLGLRMLDSLAEGGRSVGCGLNDYGVVAGHATDLADASSPRHACLWGAVTPTNHPPVLAVPASAAIPEMAPYTFTATATDADNDPLIFGLVAAPSGASIDPTTGVFTWTPTEAQGPGAHNCTVSVSDGIETAEQTITLTVTEVNLPPVVANFGGQTANELEMFELFVYATDADLPTQPLTYSLTTCPDGMAFHPDYTALIAWTPTEAQGPGDYKVTAAVSDGIATTSVTFEVHVNEVNQPPVLSVPARIAVLLGNPVTFTATATDSDAGDTLTFSLLDAPTGASMDPATGVFTWTPAATGTVMYGVQVSDGINTDTKPVRIDVYPPGTPMPASLDVLPGFEHSRATDINASGVIVGECFNGTRWMDEQDYNWTYTSRRACVWEDGVTTALPLLAGYDNSSAISLNAQGQIVGYCSVPPGNFYVAQPEACVWENTGSGWEVRALGWLTGRVPEHDSSYASDINAQGLVIGWSQPQKSWPDWPEYVLWRDGQVEAFTNLPEGYSYLQVMGWNDIGTIIGFAGTAANDWGGPAVVWDANTQTTITELPDARPRAINASGQVAGIVIPMDGEYELRDQQYVFLWDPNTDVVRNLGVPVSNEPGYIYTDVDVTGLSDAGDILLQGWLCFNPDGNPWPMYSIHGTWVYSNGEYTQIAGNLTSQVLRSYMSPAGDVAGDFRDYLTWDSFFWDRDMGAVALPGLGGNETRIAALNDAKVVVGASMTADEKMRAVVWSLAATNTPPSLTNPGDHSVDEGILLTVNLKATDSDIPAQTLTYSLTTGPDGMTIDSVTGAITWTPTEAQGPGDYDVTAEVSDGMATASVTFSVHVNEVNLPPTLIVPANIPGTVGTPVTFTASAADSDLPANTLIFGLLGDGLGARIDPETGVFTWTPTAAGAFAFDVTVSDGAGGTDSERVTINVSGAASALEASVASISRKGKNVIVTALIRNPGTDPARQVMVTAARLDGSDTSTALPVKYDSIKAGASKKCTLTFKNVPPGATTFSLSGTCSMGAFSCEEPVTVP